MKAAIVIMSLIIAVLGAIVVSLALSLNEAEAERQELLNSLFEPLPIESSDGEHEQCDTLANHENWMAGAGMGGQGLFFQGTATNPPPPSGDPKNLYLYRSPSGAWTILLGGDELACIQFQGVSAILNN